MRIKNIIYFKLDSVIKTAGRSHILPVLKSSKGNLSILLVLLIFASALLFVSLFDVFQLYIAREHTKNASDAVALALAQNLLFFDEDEILIITDEISKKNKCEIESISFGYDEITATAAKKVKFIFAGKIFKSKDTVYSTSRVKVIYPWDERFKNCDSFHFDF